MKTFVHPALLARQWIHTCVSVYGVLPHFTHFLHDRGVHGMVSCATLMRRSTAPLLLAHSSVVIAMRKEICKSCVKPNDFYGYR